MRPRKDAMVKRELTATMPSKVIVWILVVVVISFVVCCGSEIGDSGNRFLFCFVFCDWGVALK